MYLFWVAITGVVGWTAWFLTHKKQPDVPPDDQSMSMPQDASAQDDSSTSQQSAPTDSSDGGGGSPMSMQPNPASATNTKPNAGAARARTAPAKAIIHQQNIRAAQVLGVNGPTTAPAPAPMPAKGPARIHATGSRVVAHFAPSPTRGRVVMNTRKR